MGRRVLGLVLGTLGVFLVVLALGLRLAVLPTLSKAPLERVSDTVSTGRADYLDIDAGTVRRDRPLEVLQRVRGDVEAGSEDTAVYDYFVRVSDPDDVQQPLITASQTRVPFDRTTGAAVRDVAAFAGQPRSLTGQQFKLPFDTTRQGPYRLWDGTALQAVPLTFTRDETIDGVETYVFRARVEPMPTGEPLQLPGALVGRPGETLTASRVYSNTREIAVEPATGIVVRLRDSPQQLLTVGPQVVAPALLATFTTDPATLERNLSDAREGRDGLRLVGVVLPLVAGGLGLLLLLAGVLLSRARRRPEGPGQGVRGADRPPSSGEDGGPEEGGPEDGGAGDRPAPDHSGTRPLPTTRV